MLTNAVVAMVFVLSAVIGLLSRVDLIITNVSVAPNIKATKTAIDILSIKERTFQSEKRCFSCVVWWFEIIFSI